MNDKSVHFAECETCGEPFDKRSLTEVLLHEHSGGVPLSDRMGERVE